MKPTSPLSLLLFLQLANASPIRIPYIHSTSTSYRCAFASCHNYPSTNNDHTPTTKLSDPHFPAHQLSSPEEAEESAFNNRPYTPTSHITPSEALAAQLPLSSSYLKSLSLVSVAGTSTGEALPSKPTSALPDLRKEDARRYWASRYLNGNGNGEEEDGVELQAPDMSGRKMQCGASMHASSSSTAYVVREYSDVMVIGIVLFFLVIVIGLEAVEKLGNSSSSSSGSMLARYRRRHGTIFLGDDKEDEETMIWAVQQQQQQKKPFYLQPAPPPRYKDILNEKKSVETMS